MVEENVVVSEEPVVEETESVVGPGGTHNPKAEVNIRSKMPDVGEVDAADLPLLKRLAESHLAEIREKINDSNVSQIELGKLIGAEMAMILEAMNTLLDAVSRPKTAAVVKIEVKQVVACLSEQLKGVRELGKQIAEVDNLAKRDYINFDGEKFKFVADQWVLMSIAALRAMGWDEHTTTSFVKHLSSQIQMNELRIRREAENIGTIKQK